MIQGMNPLMRKSLEPIKPCLACERISRERSVNRSPKPSPPLSPTKDPSSPSPTLEDQVHDLTTRFDAYWDETQEHQVSISQDMDVLKVEMNTILCNQVVKFAHFGLI